MDIIYLKNLKIDTIIGIYAWERKIKQTIIIDLEMAFDIQPAAVNDDIEAALNYKTIADRLTSFISTSEARLIETLAEQIANIILTEFAVAWLRLSLNKKGAVGGAADVGLVIEREQKT